MNPFPGLRPFRAEEEYLFFGREKQVDAMVDKLAGTRFLAVVGTSGSGKSSLVNCGLRPALHVGLIAAAGTVWRIAQFRPGTSPIRAMAEALAAEGVLYKSASPGRFSLAEVIEASLRMSKLGLLEVFEQAHLEPGVNLLVVADQFEELFRYRKVAGPQGQTDYGPGEEATAFVNLLLEAREHPSARVYVVLTMRSDFLGDCAQFSGLPEAINAGQYLVPRMSRDERRLAIEGPVGVGGAQIAPVLLTRLVNDVGDNPDQLSILQHALNRTWAFWEKEGGGPGPIELRHYEAIGTMANALDQHAEEAFGELANGEPQRICEKIFKALTDKGTDSRGIRRPTRLSTLCGIAGANEAAVTNVIDVFRDPSRSFLMPPAGEPLRAETVIDISHESLMRVWERLKRWADKEARSAFTYRRLAETAELRSAGKANLLRDPELQLALDWRAQEQPNEAWASQYRPDFEPAMQFLRQSAAARDAELAAKRRKVWGWRLGAIGVLLVAIGTAGWFFHAEGVANNRSRSKELAAFAEARINENPELAVLLALEGLKTAHTTEARSALLAAAQYAWPSSVLRRKELGGTPEVVALSSDGSRLAVLAESEEKWMITLWDVNLRKPSVKWRKEVKAASSLAFSPSQELLAVASEASIHLLDVEKNGNPHKCLPDGLPNTGSARSIAFSPDGRWLAWAQEDGIRLLDYCAERAEVIKGPAKADVFAIVAGGNRVITVATSSGLKAQVHDRQPDGSWMPTTLPPCAEPQSMSPGAQHVSATWTAGGCTYPLTSKDPTKFARTPEDKSREATNDIVWSAAGRAFAEIVFSNDIIVDRKEGFAHQMGSRIKGANLPDRNDRSPLISMSEAGTRVALIQRRAVKVHSLADHKPFLSRFGNGSAVAVAPDGSWIAVARPPAPDEKMATIDVIPIEQAFAPGYESRVHKRIEVTAPVEQIYAAQGYVIAVLATEATVSFDAITGKPHFEPENGTATALGAARELILIDPRKAPQRVVKTRDGSRLAPWEQLPAAERPPVFLVTVGNDALAVLRVQASNPTQADALVYSVRGDSLVPSGQVVGLPAALLSTPGRLHLAADARSITEDRRMPGGKGKVEKFVWPVTGSPEPASARQVVEAATLSPSGRFEVRKESEAGVGGQAFNVLRRADGSIVKQFSGGLIDHRFSSDDRWLAVWGKDGIQVLDLALGEIEMHLNPGTVSSVEFEARNTILNVRLSYHEKGYDSAMLIPLDRALMERFAGWLVPRELMPRERCQYGLGSKEECKAVAERTTRSPDR